jgi:hypothetical protein
MKLDILDSNNFDHLCKLYSILKKHITEMEKKITHAKSVHRLDVYEQVDEEILLFGDIVETIKLQAKDVLMNEMKIMEERLQRLRSGANFFD